MGPGALAAGRWSLLGLPQVRTCDVGSRPTPGGSPAFSGESRRKERRGLRPLDPRVFYHRSFPLAGFCVGYVWTGRRAVTSGIPTPIWNAFSGKNMLKSIFTKEGFQVRG